MKIQELSSLRKRTKTSISVWRFMHDKEANVYYAVGGETLRVIPAKDRNHLRQIFVNFQRYGYAEKLPRKRQFISDPWKSELPSSLQMELEALPSS